MMTQRLIAYFTWTLPLLMILCPVQVYGVDSFCIADTIPLGGSGRVSCHFNEDLSKVPQKGVLLYRVSDSDPELVVYYFWVNGQPGSFTEPGYGCTSNLTDHLEISIYSATRDHAGLYKCVVNPSKGLNQKTCTLTIQDQEERSADVTHIYNHSVPIVLGSLALLAANIVIIIMVFRLRPQRWNNSSRTTGSPSESTGYFIAEGKPLLGNNGLDV